MLPLIWTRQRVCDALVTAFRVVPGLPIHSACRTIGASADVEVELNWRVRFLADDPDGWRYLMVWAERQAAGGRRLDRGAPARTRLVAPAIPERLASGGRRDRGRVERGGRAAAASR